MNSEQSTGNKSNKQTNQLSAFICVLDAVATTEETSATRCIALSAFICELFVDQLNH